MIIRIDKLLNQSNWAVYESSVYQRMTAELILTKLEWMKQLGNDYVLVFRSEDSVNFKVITKKDVFKLWLPETECENFSCLGNFQVNVAGDISNFTLKSPSFVTGELFVVPSDDGIDFVSANGEIQYTVKRDILVEHIIPKVLEITKLTFPSEKYEMSLRVSDDMLYLRFSKIYPYETLALLPLSCYQTPVENEGGFEYV